MAATVPGPAELDALFDAAPSLRGRPRSIEELPGGLTNRNYRVTTPQGSFVARHASRGDFLAINRDHEHRNSVAAAAAGVGAPVVDYRPEHSLLVLGYIEGRTFTDADVRDERNTPRIAAACRRLHTGPRFANDFDMFEVQRRYLAIATEHGMRVPRGYRDLAPAFAAARAALAARAEGLAPCNNDLLAGNFIDDGARLWLIDYEYSGNNDPCFELGNIAGEAEMGADGLAELVRCYYGRPLRNKIARAALFSLVSRYGWTLWGAIQQATSPIEFDFWSWAMERFEAAAAGLTGASFARLLDDAQRED